MTEEDYSVGVVPVGRNSACIHVKLRTIENLRDSERGFAAGLLQSEIKPCTVIPHVCVGLHVTYFNFRS